MMSTEPAGGTARGAPADAESKSVELSERRTGMSFQRTRMSADRTLMSVIRTSLALISFDRRRPSASHWFAGDREHRVQARPVQLTDDAECRPEGVKRPKDLLSP